MRFRRRLSSILTILGSAESFEDQVCDVVVSGIESVLLGTPTNPHHEVRPNKPLRHPGRGKYGTLVHQKLLMPWMNQLVLSALSKFASKRNIQPCKW